MRTWTRRWLVAMAGTACLLLATGVSAEEFKVAVFDPQRVSEETAIGKRVQVELTTLRDRKQTEILEMERAIEDEQRSLQQQELSLSVDKRTNMERDIQTQILQLQAAREVATRELQLEVAAAQSAFEEKLLLAVKAVGEEDGLTLVLTRDLVAWSNGGIDVTDRIIARFDQMFPAGEASATP